MCCCRNRPKMKTPSPLSCTKAGAAARGRQVPVHCGDAPLGNKGVQLALRRQERRPRQGAVDPGAGQAGHHAEHSHDQRLRQTWRMSTVLTGLNALTGPTSFKMDAHAMGYYKLVFKPAWVGSGACDLQIRIHSKGERGQVCKGCGNLSVFYRTGGCSVTVRLGTKAVHDITCGARPESTLFPVYCTTRLCTRSKMSLSVDCRTCSVSTFYHRNALVCAFGLLTCATGSGLPFAGRGA